MRQGEKYIGDDDYMMMIPATSLLTIAIIILTLKNLKRGFFLPAKELLGKSYCYEQQNQGDEENPLDVSLAVQCT